MLCDYKDALGKPKEGVHSYRVLGMAIFDIIGTIIGGWLIAYALNWNKLYTIMALFILGIILHHVFCVRTTVDKFLFE